MKSTLKTNSEVLVSDYVIEQAQREEDLPSILRLMKEHGGLTTEGIDDTKFWVARIKRGGKVIGSVGVERWGKQQALLRSLVVSRDERSKGIGGALVQRIIKVAKHGGVSEVYLLTENAGKYYLRFGFEFFERRKVKGSVLQSSEFRGTCLETAPVMRLKL